MIPNLNWILKSTVSLLPALPARTAISESYTETAVSTNFSRKCLQFTPEVFVPGGTRTVLEFVPAGTTLFFPDNEASCNRLSQFVSVDICRVGLEIPTSSRSGIAFELWLPEIWTEGRLLGTGNGGLDGCIKYEDLAYTSANGFASFGTNNGHNGTSGAAFLDNDEILEDFAHRALHTGTITSKILTVLFYERPYKKTYFLGCSLGGRMGIKAAEMYPGDFDGIVAGCPAINFNNLQSWRARFFSITGPMDSPNFINAFTWQNLIHNEVLKQCDGIDGVLDGIIEDPTMCNFDPNRLLCIGSNTEDCLNAAQVHQLVQIFNPYLWPNGSMIFPGMNPGSEILAVTRLYAGVPFSYSEDWFRYVVHRDPNWSLADFDHKSAYLASILNPFSISTYPSELQTFAGLGGKLISYHGGQDSQITSFSSTGFYDQMAAVDSDLQDYHAFFLVSGMGHCNSGPGAWVMGQGGGTASEGVGFEAEGNVLAALVRWVEMGVSPKVLRGTKFVDDDARKGVDFQRDHCRYPFRNTYMEGDHKLPGSWRCKKVQDSAASEGKSEL